MIENKSINKEKYFLGQYMTPKNLTDELLSNIRYNDKCVYVEPSFGTSNFIKSLLKIGVPIDNIVGCEIDKTLYDLANNLNFEKYNVNFYDWDFKTEKKIIFVGNPPFRTPAPSLNTHNSMIKKLNKKYGIKGIREEAVFFLLRCLEIIENNGNGGEINFILPKSMFTNNSKFFVEFQKLINSKFKVKTMIDIPDGSFESASLQMVFVCLEYVETNIEHKLGIEQNYWTYPEIFKRTYLGSVPCESIFLSSKGEDVENFKTRLVRLYSSNREDIDNNLRYNGLAHLKVLNGSNIELKNKKLDVIWDYISYIKKSLGDEFIEDLKNNEYYKIINHRHEKRIYFRNSKLKKMNFVYEINPNPQHSFYFTGNPSKSSTDYFGFCDYDITRNSSPGACRTIPTKNINENLTDEFKSWWNKNKMGDVSNIFEIFIKVSKSDWYKDMKKKYNRFYFGIPKDNDMLSKILL